MRWSTTAARTGRQKEHGRGYDRRAWLTADKEGGRVQADASRLDSQIAFLNEAEKLKAVHRCNHTVDAGRMETSAEHSWHAALMALVLSEHADAPEIDLLKVIKLLLVHDLVEIDAGDTWLYDPEAVALQAEREEAAAARVFSLLPADQARELHGLWTEFAARDTAEAAYAAAIDSFQPVVNNQLTGTADPDEPAPTKDEVLAHKRHIAEASQTLWGAAQEIVEESASRGLYTQHVGQAPASSERREGRARTASCSCGCLTATTYGEPLRVSICHCFACQRRTGSAFGVQTRFPRENVVISGRSAQYVRIGDEGNRVVFNFCPECGATVHYAVDGYDEDTVALPVGAFADPDFPPPTISVYGEQMHPWVRLPDNITIWTEESAPEGSRDDSARNESERREALKVEISRAFAETPPPDADDLRGSNEGEEPFLLEEDFEGVPDWRSLSTAFLDQSPDGFGSALSFFSAAAFRYYLPGYLLADVDDVLRQADPLFHLWHGLDDAKRDEPVNEQRYGDWTWFEAMSGRLEGFTNAEVSAIVAYLRYKAGIDECSRPYIEQALRNYWLPRLEEPVR